MDISFLRENYKDIVKTQGLEDNILKRFLKAHSKHPNVGSFLRAHEDLEGLRSQKSVETQNS